MMSFISPSDRETPRKRVRILQCDLNKMVALTVDPQSANWTVDLTVSVGDLLVWPKVGEEWYITKISDIWMLDRRAAFQNQGLGVQTLQGDRVWYNPTGRIYIEDSNGPIGVLSSGLVQMFAGITIPKGWFLCNGVAVDRLTYVNLFNTIGTFYGVGDGTTTFNLPTLTPYQGIQFIIKT